MFEVLEIESKEREAVIVRLEALSAGNQESIKEFHQKQIQLAEAFYGLQTATPNLYRRDTLEQSRIGNKLTQGQQQRLEKECKDLQDLWNLKAERLRHLRQNLAIESASAIRFQLQQQIRDEEEDIQSLNNKLAEIEQALERQENLSTLD